MHIARMELRAFPPDSPEFIVLRGVKQLRTKGTPYWYLFLKAIDTLSGSRKERPPSLSTTGTCIHYAAQNFAFGAVHEAVHRILTKDGFEDAYIRSVECERYDRTIQKKLTEFFPSQGTTCLVVTASTVRGQRVIFY